MQKAKDRYRNGGKEKAAEYYTANKEVFKKMQKINTETCQEEKKAKRLYGRNRHRNMTEDKKKQAKRASKNYQASKQ